ncbi:MAG: shikimate kinase 1 [Candidatus Westeberhardia cardiocondylae]|nr:shikimate kinase 1 [Candidatus Westeberhardia cardiocondylae]
MLKRNVFLIGPMGSGKSTIGRYLSEELNVKFFDSDSEIEKRSGVDINWIFDVEGESGFRNREKKIIEELVLKRNIILSTGGGSILSSRVRNLLSSNGIIIYLNISIEEQLFRTRFDKKRPLLLDKGKSRYEVLKTLYSERNLLYSEISDFIINVDKKSVKIISDKIINFLVNKNILSIY